MARPGNRDSQRSRHAPSAGAAVLMDERAGRQQALALGLAVTGTLDVQVRARRRGLVGLPVTAFRSGDQRFSLAAVAHALATWGEAT